MGGAALFVESKSVIISFLASLGTLASALVAGSPWQAAAPSTAPPAQRASPPAAVQPSPEALAAEAAFRRKDWVEASRLYEGIAKASTDAATQPKKATEPTQVANATQSAHATQSAYATQAWFRLGVARHSLKDYAAAVAAYRKAAEDPEARAMAAYNIGCSLALMGDTAAAISELNAAADAGFSDLAQVMSDADLASVRGDPRFSQVKRRLTPIAELVKEFSFWVGDWNALDASGNKVGTNRIELQENGCLMVENWMSVRGHTGRSINYIDPADRTWRQVWVDPGGNVIEYKGVVRDGAMHFAGSFRPQFGEPQAARATLTPQPDGSVKHVIDHSADGGATWVPYFDGVYVKKEAK